MSIERRTGNRGTGLMLKSDFQFFSGATRFLWSPIMEPPEKILTPKKSEGLI
jgi:hypothetical protein